jgi:hypothetical protein
VKHNRECVLDWVSQKHVTDTRQALAIVGVTPDGAAFQNGR